MPQPHFRAKATMQNSSSFETIIALKMLPRISKTKNFKTKHFHHKTTKMRKILIVFQLPSHAFTPPVDAVERSRADRDWWIGSYSSSSACSSSSSSSSLFGSLYSSSFSYLLSSFSFNILIHVPSRDMNQNVKREGGQKVRKGRRVRGREGLPTPHPYIPIIIVTSYFILQITYLLILILDFFSPSSNVYTLKYFFSKSGKSVGARLDWWISSGNF